MIKVNFQAQSLTESVFSILGSYNRTTKSDSKSSTGVSSARSSLPDLTSPPESDAKFALKTDVQKLENSKDFENTTNPHFNPQFEELLRKCNEA